MEDSHSFDAFDWRQICQSLRANCVRLSLSSLHFTQLFSQAVEDALRSLPPDSMMEAIDIAAEFDYETSGEVAELVRWVSDHSKCRFGIQWKNCISSCDQPCGIRRMRQ